jgi:hypothetical protein
MQPYDAYEPCGSCRRHVKRQDAACPFCGAARTPARPTAPRRIRNVSRAHWLAFGTTLVGMGCNGVLGSSGGRGVSENAPPDASTSTAPATSNGGNDASLADGAGDEGVGEDDATTGEDAQGASDGSWGSPDPSCPRSGTFACGSYQCDRASQFCSNVTTHTLSCEPLSDMTNVARVIDSGTCEACPTCACILPVNNGSTCNCFQDNFGGLTVTCSQGGCYGSPPARLERAPLPAVS